MLHRVTLFAALVAGAQHANACRFTVTTLREEAAASKFILFGRLENARGDDKSGTTDLVILRVLRSDPAIDGKKVVRIPRRIHIPDPKSPPQVVAFGAVEKGELDLFSGKYGTPRLASYVEGMLSLDAKDRVGAMRYCFDFLDDADPAVRSDARYEFRNATDAEVRRAGRSLSAEKLRRWLRDEETSERRLPFYAFLLAQCGKPGDADLLRGLLDKLVKQPSPDRFDEVLTAYTTLRPGEGWAYTVETLKAAGKPLPVRLSALLAVRYFLLTRPDVVAEKDLLGALRHALTDPEMADLAVEDLREAKCWKLTEQVFALDGKKEFDYPIFRRSLLRYAVQCPEPRAANFVTKKRKADPAAVADAEEALRNEAEPKKP